MGNNDTWKIILALFVGMGVMLGVGVYVLRKEGDKTRESMHDGMHEVAEDAGLGVQKAARESIKDSVEGSVGEATKAAKEVSGVLLGTLSEIGRGEKKDDADSAEGEDGKENQDPLEMKDKTSEILKAKPQDVIGGLFKIGNDVMKQADDAGQEMFQLDTQRENELGARLHAMLLAGDDPKIIDNEDAYSRVTDAAAPFLSRVKRDDVNYTFSIVEDKAINAFSLPGGYIYVNTGLLDFVKTDKELEFVLGHEIGHIDLRHCARNYTYAARAGEFGGELTEIAVLQIYRGYALAFSEEMEYESDKYSVGRMLEAGSNVDETLEFSEHMVDYTKSEGGETEEDKPRHVPGAIMHSFNTHFRSHPPSQSRLDRLKKFAERTEAKQ